MNLPANKKIDGPTEVISVLVPEEWPAVLKEKAFEKRLTSAEYHRKILAKALKVREK